MKQFRTNARVATKVGAGPVSRTPNRRTMVVGPPIPEIAGTDAIRRLNPGISDEMVARIAERHRRPYDRQRGHR